MRTRPYIYLKNLNTLSRNWIRRQRAKQFGVSFFRGPSFKPPDHIVVSGRRIPLLFPVEKGIKYSFMDIFLDDVYGLRDIRAPFSRILDIGANVGFFSLYARTLFPEALIHAYEPNALLAPYLRNQAQSSDIELFFEAVGLKAGKVRLDAGSESVLARSSVDSQGDIPQISLAEAVRRMGGRVDLVKLDCEGAEWQILQDRETWRNVGCLAMEYHLFAPQTSHDGISALVESAGFAITFQKQDPNGGIIHAQAKNG
ncbi:MAG: FkbM family methyltransferase [Burkholderiales bacterium]|nr:FkbM family methyltransferase [Burkholderiales bacterium]